MKGVLAIDAGQSTIKVRWRTESGSGERAFPGLLTDAPILPQIARVARAIPAGLGEIDIVSAGISGLTDDVADPDALRDLIGTAGRAILAHDSTTSFIGALGVGEGVVVAAGTGVVTLAVGPRSVARVDGWGNIMGDAGSGYWIGREALDAVMRAFDGRGPATQLTPAVTAIWPDLTAAYIDLQLSPDRISRVAAFAHAVASSTQAGDRVAIDITNRAAEQLARSVEAALRRVGNDGQEVDIAAIGGVFASAPLREAFGAATARRTPRARIVPARGAGIDGALLLAGLGSEHPLRSAIWESGSRRPREEVPSW
jgi:glucosamine kinase